MAEKNQGYKSDIDKLRRKLHKLIESESLSSETVQKMSRELDALILSFYKTGGETKKQTRGGTGKAKKAKE